MQKPRWLLSCNTQWRRLQHVSNPISAVGSGLEVSITDPEEVISLKDAKIVVESQDEDKIQVRVDLTGDATQKVFDKVLTNLARSAPPMPGFRREKGGKTSKVPKSLLLQVLGEERVTKFVIQEIVSSTMTDYTKKENLKVKDKKINTTETAQELRKLFTPGKDFRFSAVMELEKSEAETLSSSSSDAQSDDKISQ